MKAWTAGDFHLKITVLSLPTALHRPTMLHLQNLHFTYPATPGQPLFTGLTANLPAGITLVCGGDGCGKSTLLRLMAGALEPHAGQVVMTTEDRAQVFWMDPRSEAVNAALNDVVVQSYFDALAHAGRR